MPFNSELNGKQNEYDFVKNINGKRIRDLSPMIQMFLYDYYGKITNYNEYVYAWMNSKKQKTDFFIRLSSNDNPIRISLKKGVKNSVHVEPITEFIHFLIENKVPKKIIKKILLYHYADGTTNNTGSLRMDISEYKIEHQDDIDEINKYFNQEKMLKKFIKRFVTQGRNDLNEIDVLIYGVIDDFIWIKTDDIYSIILAKKDAYSSALHFGSLTYQVKNRCINRNPKYEGDRHIIQIKWYNISDDIIENMNNNVMKKMKSDRCEYQKIE